MGDLTRIIIWVKIDMTSKERVAGSIERKEIDRIPFDIVFCDSSLEKMKQYLGVESEEEVLQILKSDCRHYSPEYLGKLETLPDGSKLSFWGVPHKSEMTENGEIGGISGYPLKEMKSIDEMEDWPLWPDPEMFDYKKMKKEISEKTDEYAIICGANCFFFTCQAVRGIETFLMDLYINPEIAQYIINKVVGFYIRQTEIISEEMGEMIDIMPIFDDYGTQNGPMVSVDVFDKYFREPSRKIAEIARTKNIRVMQHSCGAVKDFIPKFIEYGAEILDPIQVTAKDMVPAELKKEFSKELCFHGGIDTQYLLPNGTEQQVKQAVRNAINAFYDGGGYILCASQDIQIDIPPKNCIAMADVNLRTVLSSDRAKQKAASKVS